MDAAGEMRATEGARAASSEAPSAAERLFDGPGELRALCRALDWAATALGAVEAWPRSLRSAVELMLAMPQPAYIGWGADACSLYNDAYISVVGARHPDALGRPYREVWPELWDEHRPILEATMRGEAQYFVDRFVPLARSPGTSRSWFTFSWTPLRDDDGRVAGFYCVATETTPAVLAREALRASDERRAYLVRLGDALRPLGDPEALKAAASRTLGERLRANRVLYAEVDGESWIVDGRFEDGVAPMPAGRDATEVYGRGLADALEAGRRVVDDDTARSPELSPSERDARLALGIVAAAAVPLVKEGRLVAAFLVHSAAAREWTEEELGLIEDTAERTWAAVERARGEAALADELRATTRLHELSVRLVAAPGLPALLQEVLDATVALHEADFGNVQLYDPATRTLRIVAQRGFEAPFLERFATVRTGDGASCGRALARGARVEIEDVEQDPEYAPSLDAARQAGYRAVQSTPLYTRAGEPLGMLSTHFRLPHRLSERERRVTDVYARLAADAIARSTAEAALRASEAGFRTLTALSPALLWQTDPSGEELSLNPRWLEYTGQSSEESQAGGWLDAIHPDERADTARASAQAYATGQPLEVEHRIRRHDGVYRWFLARQLPVRDDHGRITHWLGAAIDMQEQWRARQEVERLVGERTAERDALRRRLARAEEDERRRLSRELHDEVGQHLTALGLGLQALSDVAPPDSEVDRRAAQLRELANTLGRELHALAVRLRPKGLDDFGLEAALGAYAEEWSRQSGIAVEVHATAGAERLPAEVESTVYRVVQEALTNVAKHSGATKAGVVVERRGGSVVAIVEDDGHGFDPTAERRQGSDGGGDEGGAGLGLLGIRERVQMLGGTVEVESAAGRDGRGTTLYARIPIDQPADAPTQ